MKPAKIEDMPCEVDDTLRHALEAISMIHPELQAFIEAPEAYFAARAEWYERERYLRHVHETRLEERLADLGANLWTTDEHGAAVRIWEPPRRQFVLARILDVLQEQLIRAGSPGPLDFDEGALRAGAVGDYTPLPLEGPLPTVGAAALVRFSKRSFLEGSLREGRFRLNPAATYADSSLNAAQADDELQHHAVTPNEQIMFRMWGSRTPDDPVEEIHSTPLELYRYMQAPPFYVLCLSDRFDFRMFHDFKADAALVIHDRETFLLRLNAAVGAVLPSEAAHGPVSYYDPYRVRRPQLIPGFSKHFRYAYQNEFRATWRPHAGETPEPIDVAIGDIRDIAELVVARGG